ncbi:MAG: cyanophycin synthetase [Patescibacteria group bacterium]
MKIHLIGIGGIGTSALARIYNERGHEISGSDIEDSDLLNDLRGEGIKVDIGHDPINLPEDINLVIYSEAIPKENVELQAARSNRLTCKTYFEALGDISREYKVIAVCGTHGKTTVTAMVAKVFIDAGLDPSVVIGTKMKELGNKNYRVGKSQWLIVEACEYRRSFLHLYPDIIVLTNVEYEHPDYYKDFEDYKNAFDEFIAKLPEDGKLITSSKEFAFDLQIPGDFNRKNAGLVMELAGKLGIDFDTATTSLQEFKGTWRRFEITEEIGNTIVIDDYAHHPTEIKATLRAAREKWPEAKVLCIFQPHQYSRTLELLHEFARSFQDVNEVVISNIYEVRDTEKDVAAISPEDLVEEINKVSNNARYGGGLQNTEKILQKTAAKYDVIIKMGAGDIWEIKASA